MFFPHLSGLPTALVSNSSALVTKRSFVPRSQLLSLCLPLYLPISAGVPPDPAGATPASPVMTFGTPITFPCLVSHRAPIPVERQQPSELAGGEEILLDEGVKVAIEHGVDIPHFNIGAMVFDHRCGCKTYNRI